MADLKKRRRVTLYFTNGAQLTEEDYEAMSKLRGDVRHRNAEFIDPDAKLEDCDAVAGPAVPEQYAAKYATADGDAEQNEDDTPAARTPWGGKKAGK